MEKLAVSGKIAPSDQLSPEVNRLIHKGRKHFEKKEWERAAKYYVAAWNLAPEDKRLLTIVSHLLVQLGVREQAIAVLEKALEVNGPTQEILGIIGQMALEMRMMDIAEKLFDLHVQLFPGVAYGYNSLANALGGQERYDDSIAMLQEILPLFPEDGSLWNTLASHVSMRDGLRDSIVFYQEAYRLSRKDYRVPNNLARVHEQLNEFEEARKWGERSAKLKPGDPEPLLGLGTTYLTLGNLKKGWHYYQYRLDKRRKSMVVHYTHKLPAWDGRSLKNKSILVASEQGVGDEILFGLALPRIMKEAKKVYIGCDSRLISVFQRSFPEAEIVGAMGAESHGYYYRGYPELEERLKSGETKIDCATEFGSIPRFHWTSVEDIPRFEEGFLKTDDARVADWKKRLAALGDKPKVGIAWRSSKMTADRKRIYLTIEDLQPILQTPGVEFVNVQYGDCAEDIGKARDEYGITIHEWDDLDLRDDFEGTLAMMKNLDLIIGPTSTPAIMGMGVGKPVWWLARHTPWWTFGTGTSPFHAKGSVTIAQVETPWLDTTPGVGDRLARAAKAGDFTIE